MYGCRRDGSLQPAGMLSSVRRERLASQAKARLVFWLDEAAIQAASQAAPDLWAWRGGVYAFKPTRLAPNTLPHLIKAEPFERKTPLNAATLAERHRRVVEIQTWIKDHPDAPDELLVARSTSWVNCCSAWVNWTMRWIIGKTICSPGWHHNDRLRCGPSRLDCRSAGNAGAITTKPCASTAMKSCRYLNG